MRAGQRQKLSLTRPHAFPRAYTCIVTSDSAAQHPNAFASDNWSGVHPEIMDAIVRANIGHAEAYGGDLWTAEFQDVTRRIFGPDATAYPVFNGTGGNVLALQAALPRWGSVICAASSHIYSDETGAPEKTGGIKLHAIDTPDGKLTPELVDQEAWGWGNEHRAEPFIVSISQTTEFGTCYTPREIQALADQAHDHGMLLHVDGSRLGNAAAHLGVGLAEITSDVGVDLLTLGGTKNGALAAEAVVTLRPGSTPGMPSLRKINLQLASKMRFASAQLTALYGGDLWLRSATHSNTMAQQLAEGLQRLIASGAVPGVRIEQSVESNAVFVVLPEETAARALDEYAFGSIRGTKNLFRLMCSFDTTDTDVEGLLAAIAG